MAINTMRHESIFNPYEFNEQIHVIGCGATGSKIIKQLADLGIDKKIHIWDFDKVEEHNLCNQEFSLKHIGMNKAEAMADIVKEKTGVTVFAHPEKVENQRLKGIVFLLVDTMSGRREIFENCIQYNEAISLVIETRMSVHYFDIFLFDPMNLEHAEKWENTLVSDDIITDVSPCGTSITVGATAEAITSHAIWQFINYNNKEKLPNVIKGFMKKPKILTFSYDDQNKEEDE